MAVATSTAIIAGAALTATTAAVAADQQNQASRRAETRSEALANEERNRQKKQAALIAAQEGKARASVAGKLRATAGKRAGRRSLISETAAGVSPAPQLGSQETLG